jgi:hypothetical protein
LAKKDDILKSRLRLADIVGYKLPESEYTGAGEKIHSMEEKKSDQLFLGLESGQLVSLIDEKVFEPTHPALIDYYRGSDAPFSDNIR